MNIKHAAT